MPKPPPQEKKQEDSGAPAYMTTFADLMSLLMCFFVLMLSFSEMDRQKFKIMAGSFKEAFGVQRNIKVWDLPKGISIVALNFNDPNFSEVNLIYDIKSAVRVANIGEKEYGEFKLATGDKGQSEVWLAEKRDLNLGDHKEGSDEPGEKGPGGGDLDLASRGEDESAASYLREDGIAEEEFFGEVTVREDEKSITVIFPERILFDSGSAQIRRPALRVLDGFRGVMLKHPNPVMVVGHTDNVPINTAKYPSNWELSAARAGSIIRFLLEKGSLDPDRFTAIGRADTVPAAANDTPQGRAKNRRVELVFKKRVFTPRPAKIRPPKKTFPFQEK